MSMRTAILSIPIGQRRAVSDLEAQRLQALFQFTPSTGFPFWAVHRRAALPDGSCLHLVRLGTMWTIHRDLYNPDRDVISAIKHMVHEAPTQTIMTGAMVFVGVALLRAQMADG